MSEIRIGFIGAGGIMERHAAALATIPDVEVVGYVSPSGREAPYGQMHHDLDGLLDQRIDAAVVGVPPYAHIASGRPGIEEQLIAADVPFLTEKPVGLDRDYPEDVALLVKERGLVTAVGYQWWASPVSRRAEEFLASRTVEEVTVNYLDPAMSYVEPWWLDRRKSGGQVLEQTVHPLHEAERLLGGGIEVVRAEENFWTPDWIREARPEVMDSDVPTNVHATVVFSRDGAAIPGKFHASAVTQERTINVVFACDNGSRLVVDRQRVSLQRGEGDNEKTIHLTPALEDFTGIPTREQDRAFVAAVRAGDPTLVYTSYPQAMETHRAAIAITEKGIASNRNRFV